MNCKCSFKFSGAGEFRNCEAFVTSKGESGITCPKCDTSYVNGAEVALSKGNQEHLTNDNNITEEEAIAEGLQIVTEEEMFGNDDKER